MGGGQGSRGGGQGGRAGEGRGAGTYKAPTLAFHAQAQEALNSEPSAALVANGPVFFKISNINGAAILLSTKGTSWTHPVKYQESF